MSNKTIIKLYEASDKKNLSKIDIKPISEQADQIKSLYGDVFCYSMKSDEKIEFCRDHCVFNNFVNAFKEHRPITISPDIIWLLIVQGFVNHVNNNAEELRPMFVNFDGKKELTVKRKDLLPSTATAEDWMTIFPEFINQIKEFTGSDVCDTLKPTFTTTTPISSAVGQLSIMSAMKEYFDYKVIMCECAFPYIIVEGTRKDWEMILSKLNFLRKYNLNEWVDKLNPIISQIIDSKRGIIDKKFWKNMIHIVDTDDCYEPGYIDGWFVNFFLYNIYGDKVDGIVYENDFELTSEMLTVPFKLIVLNEQFDCEFVAGFVGISQDDKYKSIKPEIHFLIRLEDKEQKMKDKIEIERKKKEAASLDPSDISYIKGSKK